MPGLRKSVAYRTAASGYERDWLNASIALYEFMLANQSLQISPDGKSSDLSQSPRLVKAFSQRLKTIYELKQRFLRPMARTWQAKSRARTGRDGRIKHIVQAIANARPAAIASCAAPYSICSTRRGISERDFDDACTMRGRIRSTPPASTVHSLAGSFPASPTFRRRSARHAGEFLAAREAGHFRLENHPDAIVTPAPVKMR